MQTGLIRALNVLAVGVLCVRSVTAQELGEQPFEPEPSAPSPEPVQAPVPSPQPPSPPEPAPRVAPADLQNPADPWSSPEPQSELGPERRPVPAFPTDDLGTATLEEEETELRSGPDLGFSIGAVRCVSTTDVANVGPSTTARFAYAFGWVAPQFSLGYQLNTIEAGPQAGTKLQAVPLGLAFRVQRPAPAILRPFIGVSIDITWWNLSSDTTIDCESANFYCYSKLNWSVVPGASRV